MNVDELIEEEAEEVSCDVCGSLLDAQRDPRYSCDECGYDVCEDCFMEEIDHEHPLAFVKPKLRAKLLFSFKDKQTGHTLFLSNYALAVPGSPYLSRYQIKAVLSVMDFEDEELPDDEGNNNPNHEKDETFALGQIFFGQQQQRMRTRSSSHNKQQQQRRHTTVVNRVLYHNINIPDLQDPHLLGEYGAHCVMEEGTCFLHDMLRDCGGNVLVHCKEGQRRSPTMFLAWMVTRGMRLSEAIDTLGKGYHDPVDGYDWKSRYVRTRGPWIEYLKQHWGKANAWKRHQLKWRVENKAKVTLWRRLVEGGVLRLPFEVQQERAKEVEARMKAEEEEYQRLGLGAGKTKTKTKKTEPSSSRRIEREEDEGEDSTTRRLVGEEEVERNKHHGKRKREVVESEEEEAEEEEEEDDFFKGLLRRAGAAVDGECSEEADEEDEVEERPRPRLSERPGKKAPSSLAGILSPLMTATERRVAFARQRSMGRDWKALCPSITGKKAAVNPLRALKRRRTTIEEKEDGKVIQQHREETKKEEERNESKAVDSEDEGPSRYPLSSSDDSSEEEEDKEDAVEEADDIRDWIVDGDEEEEAEEEEDEEKEVHEDEEEEKEKRNVAQDSSSAAPEEEEEEEDGKENQKPRPASTIIAENTNNKPACKKPQQQAQKNVTLLNYFSR
ncbi:coiled-coil domain-containing glutamate-rich protein 1 [Balamuthia mandrillaris]